MSRTADLGVVVVHHRSLNTLQRTLNGLQDAGLHPESVVIVDNSGRSVASSDLVAVIPPGMNLLRTHNFGYAAAVNTGVAELLTIHPRAQRILVATHESLVGAPSLGLMCEALDADQSLGAVGPVLKTPEGALWSAGGRLTPVLRIPRHVTSLNGETGHALVQPVSWLDGALVLYRVEAISGHPLDERFFLYMEEVDYHQQLAERGWRVGVCRRAIGVQDSKGMPPYYAARNMWLFQSKWGRLGFKRISVVYTSLRTAARGLRHRDWESVRRTYEGYRAGRALLQ